MDMNRCIAGVAAVTLALAACGGGDDDTGSTTSPSSSVPTSDSVSASSVATTSSPTSSSSASTPSSIVVTATTAPITTTPPGTNTAATTTAPIITTPPPTTADVVDESALALLEAGLFTIPGANVQCGIGAAFDSISMVYAYAAEGGDLYVICADASEPLGDDRLRLTTPSSRLVTDLRLDPTGEFSNIGIGRDATNVVATGADGRRRVLGTLFDDGSRNRYQIPLFLAHDREAGSWTIEFNGVTASVDVRRPCATSGPGNQGDPTVFDPRIRFQRSGPVEFQHCRAFPDVSGRSIDDAVNLLRDHYDRQGIVADIGVSGRGCGGEVVTGSSEDIGDVDEGAINDRQAFPTLDVELDCPTAPDLVGRDFDEATTILDGFIGDFPDFTWSADATCESGTTVAEQSPAPGSGAASIALVRCE